MIPHIFRGDFRFLKAFSVLISFVQLGHNVCGSSTTSTSAPTTTYTTESCFNEMVRRSAKYILALSGQEDANSTLLTCPGDYPTLMGNVLESFSENSTGSSDYSSPSCYAGYIGYLGNDVTRRFTDDNLNYESDSCIGVTVGAWLNYIDRKSVNNLLLDECHSELFKKWILNLIEKNAFSDINGYTDQCMDARSAQWIEFLTLISSTTASSTTSTSSASTNTKTVSSTAPTPQPAEVGCFNEIVRRSSAYVLALSGEEDADSSIATCPEDFPSLMATILENKTLPTNSSEASEYITPICVNNYISFLISDVSIRINNNFLYYETESCMEATVGTWLGFLNVLATANGAFDQCHLDLFAKWVDGLKSEILKSDVNSTDEQCIDQKSNEWMNYLMPPSTSSVPTSTSTERSTTAEVGCFNEIVRRSSAFVLFSSGEEDVGSSFEICPGGLPSLMANVLENKTLPTNSTEGSEYVAPYCVEHYVSFLISDVSNRINNNFLYYETESCMEATVGTWLGFLNVLATANAAFDQCHLDLFAQWVDGLKGEILKPDVNSTDDQCVDRTTSEWMAYLNPTDDVNVTSTNISTPEGPRPFPTEFCLDDMILNFSAHILQLLDTEDTPFDEITCPGNFSTLIVEILENITAEKTKDVSGNISIAENKTMPMDDNNIYCVPNLISFLDDLIKPETNNSSPNVTDSCMETLLRSALLFVDGRTAAGDEFNECQTEHLSKWLQYLQEATVEESKDNQTDTDLCVLSVTTRWIQYILTPPVDTTTEALTSVTTDFNMTSSDMPSSTAITSALTSSATTYSPGSSTTSTSAPTTTYTTESCFNEMVRRSAKYILALSGQGDANSTLLTCPGDYPTLMGNVLESFSENSTGSSDYSSPSCYAGYIGYLGNDVTRRFTDDTLNYESDSCIGVTVGAWLNYIDRKSVNERLLDECHSELFKKWILNLIEKNAFSDINGYTDQCMDARSAQWIEFLTLISSTTASSTTSTSSASTNTTTEPSTILITTTTTIAPASTTSTTANPSPSISLANSPFTTVSPITANSSPSISLANSPSMTVSPITANSSPSISLANSPSTTVSPITANSSPSISLSNGPSTNVSPTTTKSSPSISLANSLTMTISTTPYTTETCLSEMVRRSTAYILVSSGKEDAVSILPLCPGEYPSIMANTLENISVNGSFISDYNDEACRSSYIGFLQNDISRRITGGTLVHNSDSCIEVTVGAWLYYVHINSVTAIPLPECFAYLFRKWLVNLYENKAVSDVHGNTDPCMVTLYTQWIDFLALSLPSSTTVSSTSTKTVSSTAPTPQPAEVGCFNEIVRRSSAYVLALSGEEDADSSIAPCPEEFPSLMATILENKTLPTNSSEASEYITPICVNDYISFLISDVSIRINNNFLYYETESCMEATVGTWLGFLNVLATANGAFDQCHLDLFAKWVDGLKSEILKSDVNSTDEQCVDQKSNEWMNYLMPPSTSSVPTSTSTERSTTAEVGCFNEIVRRSSAFVLFSSEEEDVGSSFEICPGGFPSLMANVLENKTLPTNSTEGSEYVAPYCVEHYVSFLISDVSNRINNNFLYYETESCMEATVGTWMGLLDVLATANAAYNQCHLDLFAKWVDGLKSEILKSDVNSTDEQCIDQKSNEWMNYLMPPSTSSVPTSTSTERSTTAEVGCFDEIVRRSSAFVLFSSGEEDVGSSFEICPGGFPSLMANVLENKTLPTNSTEGSEYVAPYCVEHYVSFLISDVSNRINNNFLYYETESCMEATVGTWLGFLNVLATANAAFDQCHLDLFAQWVDGLKGEILKPDVNSTDDQCVDRTTSEWMAYLNPTDDVNVTSTNISTPEGPRPFPTEFCLDDMILNFSAHILQLLDTEDTPFDEITCPGNFSTLIVEILENITAEKTKDVSGNISIAENKTMPMDDNNIYCVPNLISFLDDLIKPETNNSSPNVTDSCMETLLRSALLFVDGRTAAGDEFNECQTEHLSKWLQYLQEATVEESKDNQTDTDLCVLSVTTRWIQYILTPPVDTTTEALTSGTTDFNMTSSDMPSSTAPTSALTSSATTYSPGSSTTSTSAPTTTYTTESCFNEMVRRSAKYILALSGQGDANSTLLTCPGDYPTLMGNVLESFSENSTGSSDYSSPSCYAGYIGYLGNDVTRRFTDDTLNYESDSCIGVTVGAWLNYIDRKSVNERLLDECHSELFKKWILNLIEKNAFSDINGYTDQCMDARSAQWIEFLTLISSTTASSTTSTSSASTNTTTEPSTILITTTTTIAPASTTSTTANPSPSISLANSPFTTVSPITANSSPSISLANSPSMTVSPITANSSPSISLANSPSTTVSPITANSSPSISLSNGPSTNVSPTTTKSSPSISLANSLTMTISTTPYTTETCLSEMVRRSTAYILVSSGKEDAVSILPLCPGEYPSIMANTLENISVNGSFISDYNDEACRSSYIGFLQNDISRRITGGTLVHNSDSCIEVTVGAWLYYVHINSGTAIPLPECFAYLFRKWLVNLYENKAVSDVHGNTDPCMVTLYTQWIDFLALSLPSSTTVSSTSTKTVSSTAPTPQPAEVGCFNEIVRRSSAYVLALSGEEDADSSIATCPEEFPSLMATILENKTLPTNSSEASEYITPICVNDYISFLISDVSIRINNNFLYYETESCMEATVGTWLGFLNVLATANGAFDQCHLDLFAKWVDGLKSEILKSDVNSTDEQCVDQKSNEWMNYLMPPSTSSVPTSTSTERSTTAEVGCFNEIVRRSSAFVLFSSGEEDVGSSFEICPGGFPSLMANVLENNTLPTNSTEGSEYVAPYCVEHYVSFLISDVSNRINNNFLYYETESCMEATVGTWMGLLDVLATAKAAYNQCHLDLFAKWVDGLKSEILKSDVNSTDEQCIDQKSNEWMNYLMPPSTSSVPTSTSTERSTTAEVGCFDEIVRRSSAFVLFSSGEEDVVSSFEICPGGFPSLMANVLENKTLPTNSTEGSEYVAPYCVEHYVSFLISDVSNRINNNFLYYETESCMEATVGTWLGLLDVLATAKAAYNQCHLDLFAKWVDGLKSKILKSDVNSTDEQCIDQKSNEWMNYLMPPSTSSVPTSTSTERSTTAEVGCFDEIVRRSSAFVLFSSGEEDVGSSFEICPGGFPSLMANVLENKTLPTNSTEGSEYVAPYCVEHYVSFLISDVSNRINNNFLYYETESCMEATVGTWLGFLNVLATANGAFDQCHLDLFAKWVDGLKGEILKPDVNSTDDQCVDRTTSEWMAYLNPTDDVNVTSTNISTPEGPRPFPTEFCLDDMILNFSAHILQLLDTEDTPFDEITCPGNFSTLIVEILENITAEKTKDVSGNISIAENKTMPMDDNNIYCVPNLISFLDDLIKPETNNSSPNVTDSCMETLLRSALLFVDGRTAAGDEFNECQTEHLSKWLQYLQEATVEESKDNQTDTDLCVLSVTTRWIQYILTPPVDTTTEALTSGTTDFNMTSSDMPSSTAPTSALTSSATTYSPDEEECLLEPCQNGALFCPNASGIFVCNCLGSFYGEFCEQIDVEGAAEDIESLDFTATGSISVVTNVMDTLISSAISVDNITALGDVTNTISSIVDKLSTASLSEEELKSVGTTLLVGSGSILSSLTSSQSNSSCGASGLCEGAQETAQVMDKVLGNTVNLGSVVLKDMTEGSFEVKSETMNLTFNKADTESLTASTKGADVALPSSLRDRVGRTGMMLAKLDIKKDIYSLARTKDNVTSAVKRLNLVTQSGGEVEDLDPDDPVVIEVDADSNEPFSTLTLTTEGSTLTAVQEIKLVQTTPITIAEFEVPPGKKVLCRGRFGELPRQYERDFEIIFETDISIVVKNDNVRYQHSDGQLFVIFSSSKLEGADAFLVLEYSDSAINPSRRKRSISNPTMRSRTLAPKVWNAATLSWDVNPNLQLSGITSTGKAQFKSNFFGTFAVSEVIIAPTPIDFNRLFLNFAKYLQDSPYVLAVNCFFITMTIVIALILRRSDNVDRDLWKYYPLVDNSANGRYTYAISLHTSIRSAGNLTATPFLILIGSEGRTESRLLSDGCRKNFRPGSVSNFYLTSDVELGAVKKLKLWHDNQGKSTNWHVDRIIVNDMQNLSKFVFLCQKWLTLEKDDGRLCRTFSAFTEDDKPDLLDIVAKQKLFDDHLWLSLVKRPTFSRFTRVQRFLCAVAMLFLSMVTSAMWYEDYDGASKQSSGLEIGPISLTFRQLYVGVMSSVIIVIPGITMTIAFKRRKFKGEVIKENNGCCSCFGYFSGKKLFPWWFIFLGYFLVVAAIGASAFFTFMYSLQWGGITSLNWLMSLVFCTSGSTGLVEPVKIIVLAVALSSVFKKSAKEDIASVAPLQLEEMNVIGQVKTREIPEPPDDNCEDIVKRRHQLVQKTKLVNIGKSLLAKLVLVGLLLVICLHSEVLDSYRLNTFVRTYAAESFISKNVERRGDVWVWLNSSFIPSMIPKYKYNNDLMPVYDQRFVSDGSNIRMGPISLRQYRVVDSCQHNILTRRYKMPMLCTPEYMGSTAEINTFKEGWTSCHNTTCAEVPFRLTLSSGGSTVDTEGTFSTYGDGSYIESWDEDQTYALSRSTFLSYKDWLDINSRALIVESSLYNPNVALFTRLQVLFEFPTIGGVTYNVDVKSAKLYPYTTIWDYLVLLLQIVFMLTVLVRLCMFFRSVLCCKNRMNCGTAVVFGIEMLLSLAAMAVYGVKIDRTIFTVEELHNNPNSYVSFDLVFLLEDVFRFTLSMTLFIRILHLLEPLTFSHSLFVFRSTVIAARRELLSFTIVLIVIVTAFGCLFYLLEGPVTYDIRSMGVVYLTLFQTLLGMVKSSQFQFQETGLELYVKQYTFVIFYFSATLILVNIAIIILSTDLSAMQGHKDFSVGPDYDQELNDYFWDIVSRFLKKFTIQSKQEIEEEKAKLDAVDNHPILENTSKIQDKLDEIMWKLTTNNEEDLSSAAQLAKKALHGLYGVKISSVRGLAEVDIGKVDRAALYVDSTVDAMPSPRLVREITPIMNKHVFYNRRASIEPNMITMSLNDATGSGSMTITEFGSRQLTNEPLHVQDVTEVEKFKIQRVSLTPFGKVFRLNGSFKDQGFNNKIIFLLSRHPRSYEKLSIAVKGQGSSQWTCLTSTCDPGNLNTPFTTVTAFSDVIPEFVTCISEERTYMQVITPSGVEFSLPFEPRSKITFSKGCVLSECVATFKLIPKRPYPVIQITHNGTVQLSVKVQLPVIYPGGDSDEDGEPTVVTSMSDRKWWTVPFRFEMDNTVVTFNANLAPTNIKVAYCVKLSEIEQVKRGNSEKPDFLTSDTLCGICRMIGDSWGELATALGMPQPHIYMMLTNIRSSVPVNPCRHLLSQWNKQLPVAADRMRYMKAALRKIKRFDVIEWIDNHEETPRPSSMPKDLNKLKAFNMVIKHPIVCENWLRLAEACCLHQEEITLIDSDVPRTDAEKAFLVLSKWSEKYPIFNVTPLQKILMLAGFPHIANKTMDSPTESRRRFSRLGRTVSKASLLYK